MTFWCCSWRSCLSSNRDTKALHLKLDALLRAVQAARNDLINLEQLSDVELEQLQEEFHRLSTRRGQSQTGNNFPPPSTA